MPRHDDIRSLMIAALDGEAVPALGDHLATCSDCADEWQRVAAIDRLLRTTPAVDPPPGFALGVQRQLATALGAETAWRRVLANIGLVTTGIATVLFAAATMALYAGSGGATRLFTRAPAISEALLALADTAVRGPLGAIALSGLAAGLAMAWFAILFLPRLAPQAGRSRTVRRR